MQDAAMLVLYVTYTGELGCFANSKHLHRLGLAKNGPEQLDKEMTYCCCIQLSWFLSLTSMCG